jgi:hypothetical protein
MKKISDAEYQARIAAAQKKMAADGIDAIIAHSHEADFATLPRFLSIESQLNPHIQVLNWILLKVLPKIQVVFQNLRK